MDDLSEIKSNIEPALLKPVNLDEVYEAFCEETGFSQQEEFIEYLHQKELISDQTLFAVQPDEVDVLIGEGLKLSTSQKRYEFLNTVGEGAMGKILLVKELNLQRKVAFKELHHTVGFNRETLRRFFNEVQITAQLDHPNIVPVYSLEVSSNGLAYTMKLVKGKTLKDVIIEARKQIKNGLSIKEIKLQLTQRLNYFLRVCEAMHFAHKKGAIHRDLKPANIMVGAYNEVYVMDWGIARLFQKPSEGEPQMTQSIDRTDIKDMEATQVGQILGTPRYMSPEQAKGLNHSLDPRSDQFALGLILFELVLLKPALKAKTPVELFKRLLSGQLQPFNHFHPGVKIPVELKAIIEKSTALLIEDRYESVESMAEDIRQFLRGEAVDAHEDTLFQKMMRAMNHHQEKALAIFMSLILIGLSGVIASLYSHQQAMLSAKHREDQLTTFLKNVYQQSYKINNRFLQVESSLNGLASVTRAYLTQGPISQEPILKQREFSPEDYLQSKYYGLKISVDWPISLPSYNANQSDYIESLKRVLPVRYYLRKMFSKSYHGKPPSFNKEEQRRKISDLGGPIMWMTIVLKEGVSLGYPGTDFDSKFDGRQRPYYKLAAHKYGPQWGNPYLDVTARGLMLPCAMSIYDQLGEFRGVVAVDMIFDDIIDNLLHIPNSKAYAKTTYLLDEKGRIVLNSHQKNQQDKSMIFKDLKLPLFENKQLIDAMKQELSGGYIEVDNQELIAFSKMDALGWYYVVKTDLNTLLTQSFN